MELYEKVEKAKELGKKAFEEGKTDVPAEDLVLMALMEGLKAGQGLLVLRAWSTAWHTANVNAPLPPEEED